MQYHFDATGGRSVRVAEPVYASGVFTEISGASALSRRYGKRKFRH